MADGIQGPIEQTRISGDFSIQAAPQKTELSSTKIDRPALEKVGAQTSSVPIFGPLINLFSALSSLCRFASTPSAKNEAAISGDVQAKPDSVQSKTEKYLNRKALSQIGDQSKRLSFDELRTGYGRLGALRRVLTLTTVADVKKEIEASTVSGPKAKQQRQDDKTGLLNMIDWNNTPKTDANIDKAKSIIRQNVGIHSEFVLDQLRNAGFTIKE